VHVADRSAPTKPDLSSPSGEGTEVAAELTEAERAILEKYDIDPDDARKAFEELLGLGMSNAATGEEFSEEQGKPSLISTASTPRTSIGHMGR
jgi:hypothetical protein